MPDPLVEALAEIDGHLAGNHYANAPVLRARVRAMLRAYSATWQDTDWKYAVLGAERLLLAPFTYDGVDTGYVLGGKLDVLLRETHGRKRDILLDHKFLSQGFDENDIEHLMISGQPNQYAMLGLAHGIRFHTAMWDIIVKPTHRPGKGGSKVVKAAKPERTHKGTGKVLPAEPEVREDRPAETMEEFEERVFGVMTENAPRFFCRPEVPIMQANVAESMEQIHLWLKDLHAAQKQYKLKRNPDACMMYNHPCTYLGLCSGRSREDDGTWKKKENIHAELDLPEGVNPFKVITNSRLATFRACPLKHHRKYVLGIDKMSEEEVESLNVGQLGHVGLEHYWKAIGKGES